MTAASLVACPGGPLPGPVDASLRTCTADVTRVLVVGSGSGDRVRWALTQVWRRAGRPLRLGYGVDLPMHQAVFGWWREHRFARVQLTIPRGEPFEVLLVFGSEAGLSAALRAAMPAARRCGLVVDGDRVGEFR